MKTRIKTLAVLTMAALGCTACSEKVSAMTEIEGTPVEQNTTSEPTPSFSIQYTTDVPSVFLRAANQKER